VTALICVSVVPYLGKCFIFISSTYWYSLIKFFVQAVAEIEV
jgi:hypothetical protein